MDTKIKDIIIKEGNRPLWQLVIAGAGYTAILFLAYICYENGFSMKMIEDHIELFEFCIILFVLALNFSAVTNIYFDLKLHRYKKETAVGPICIGRWHHLPEIEYISVFRQNLKDDEGNYDGYVFDVNVWHETSKHFTIYTSLDVEPAFEMASYIAGRLQVDMLDASIPDDHKWVEINPDTPPEYTP